MYFKHLLQSTIFSLVIDSILVFFNCVASTPEDQSPKYKIKIKVEEEVGGERGGREERWKGGKVDGWIEPQGKKQSPSALDKTRGKSLSYPCDLRQKEKMTDS